MTIKKKPKPKPEIEAKESWFDRLTARMTGASIIASVMTHWVTTGFKFESHDYALIFVLLVGVILAFPTRAKLIGNLIVFWRKA